MKLAVVLTVAVLAVSGCSDSGDERGAARTTTSRPLSPTTTLKLLPGFHYTDCSKIRAGDTLDSESLRKLYCDPANAATLLTLDCKDGMYVELERPEGNLEAFLAGPLTGTFAPTTWQTAGEMDESHKTPFARQVCVEH